MAISWCSHCSIGDSDASCVSSVFDSASQRQACAYKLDDTCAESSTYIRSGCYEDSADKSDLLTLPTQRIVLLQLERSAEVSPLSPEQCQNQPGILARALSAFVGWLNYLSTIAKLYKRTQRDYCRRQKTLQRCLSCLVLDLGCLTGVDQSSTQTRVEIIITSTLLSDSSYRLLPALYHPRASTDRSQHP